jgi:hypothetical protein
MVRSSVRAVVLAAKGSAGRVESVGVVEAVARLKVVLFGLGIKDVPELVEVVIKDNLGAYKEMFDGCRV